MKATAKELRFNSKMLLAAVGRGDDVIITFRGKPCAKLVPYVDATVEKSAENEDQLFGIWQDRDDIDVDSYVRNLRKSRFS